MNRVRTKIANELKNYGRRVQYSVFECELSEKKFGELYGKLSGLMQMTCPEDSDNQEKMRKAATVSVYIVCVGDV